MTQLTLSEYSLTEDGSTEADLDRDGAMLLQSEIPDQGLGERLEEFEGDGKRTIGPYAMPEPSNIFDLQFTDCGTCKNFSF